MWPFSKKKSTTKTNQDAYYTHDINPVDNSLVSFQTFGNSSVSFVPLFGNNKLQNDEILCKYFNDLAEVSAPIKKYSDGVVNVPLYFIDNNGKELINNPLIPVVNTFWQRYRELLVIYDLLLGNSYIQALTSQTFASRGAKTLTELFLLPSEFTWIETPSYKMDFRKPEIKRYVVSVPGNYNQIYIDDLESVLHIKEGSTALGSQNGLYGISRLAPCSKNIRSIASGYGAKVSLYDNGPRAIITGKRQGNNFENINEEEDTEAIQKRVNDIYGRTFGQHQILVTKTPLDVTLLSLNVNDLQLNPMNASDFRRICAQLGQDSKIHGDPDSTAYNNMTEATSDFYNYSFKNKIDGHIDAISNFVKKWDNNFNAKADYSKIPQIADFERANEEKLFERVKQGMMTRNEYLLQIGEPIVNRPDFNDYYVYGNDGKWYQVGETIQTQNA